ncbi:hypothetical protein BU24DRAFT_462128 [Aaosphaeria arxii CBS 175.79]|uniref:Uncharacterized protein n=1 Tax=Aaosphaeria arxii CBS 175.79 TaxID=1450172 RepID=A0A6A5XSW9_9PLEO|nr:uncharacterized protein BU24DRAFT_462128 [Aaosphaeria arxii CBS 175.79]KAF2015907.1 hypothetical protein BU24DRAFT_462128 [Aaosphaeria arxii CBS 175.79]
MNFSETLSTQHLEWSRVAKGPIDKYERIPVLESRCSAGSVWRNAPKAVSWGHVCNATTNCSLGDTLNISSGYAKTSGSRIGASQHGNECHPICRSLGPCTKDILSSRSRNNTGAMWTAKHIQSQSACTQEAAWFPIEAQDEEGAEAFDAKDLEGTMEFEPLSYLSQGKGSVSRSRFSGCTYSPSQHHIMKSAAIMRMTMKGIEREGAYAYNGAAFCQDIQL